MTTSSLDAGAVGADFEAVGQMYDVLAVWQAMAHDVQGVAVERCGAPAARGAAPAGQRELLQFLQGWSS